MAEETKLDILVVDDNEGHSELVRRNLRRNGISNSITSLTNGADALDYVYRRGKYASRPLNELLILLDINMPGGVNGIDVLSRIKSDPAKKKIPVIMLTTTDDPKEIERCYALGCNIYITKPVEPEAFVEAVRRLGLFVLIVNLPSSSSEEAPNAE